VQPWPKPTAGLPALFGCWITAEALEAPAQGTLEKNRLTGTVALPAPGPAGIAKLLLLASRGWFGDAATALTEPAIVEPGAAFRYPTTKRKSHR
jgi:hypothetical protein